MGGGGGGGSVNIAPRQPGQEKGTIGNWYNFQQNQYGNYLANNPLLNTAQTGALGFFGGLPGLTAPLGAVQGQAPGFYGGLQNQLGGLSNQIGGLIPGLQSQLGKYQGQFGDIYRNLGGQANLLQGLGMQTLLPTILSQGALTPEQTRDVSQQTRAIQAAQGTATTNQDLGAELLNREALRNQRFTQALGLGQGLEQQVSGIYGQQAGLTGQQGSLAGLGTQLASGLLGQRAGIAGQQGGLFGQYGTLQNLLSAGQQGLQTGGLNQLLGVGNAAVNQFSGLTNPILGYLGNLFQGNLESRIAGAQIGAQQNIANQNKNAGGISGAISAVGPILGAVLSDEKLKTKIRDTGLKTSEGVKLKTWEYQTRPGVRFLGPIAQDVEKKLPERVLTDPRSGLKAIVGFPVIELKPSRKEA